MKCHLLFCFTALVSTGTLAHAQQQPLEQIAPASDPLPEPIIVAPNIVVPVDPPLVNAAPTQGAPVTHQQLPNEQPVRQGLHIGSPNAIKIGGGEGLRIGPPRMGVQYGGGQGIRYGTDRIGVRYGGGEGVRYGTRNIGVQYGGGQILRWGTPNAGVKIGGGEGFRIGTRNYGFQFGTGYGLQIGRIQSTGN